MKRFNTRLFGRLLPVVGAVTLAATVLAMGTSAAESPYPYANGFESEGDAVLVDVAPLGPTEVMFNVERVASGTDRINSASGSYHAVADARSGKFTRYGGYSPTFPAGGYTTSADIYLDTAAATGGARLFFDWSSATSNTSGGYGRDFIFNVGTDGTNGFVVTASNNAGGNPASSGRILEPITTSGWYTFQHRFYNNGTGVLAADLSILDSSGATLKTWTLSEPADIIGQTMGGNRYGWLLNNTQEIALDNVTRSSVCTPTGFYRDNINLTAALIDPASPVTGEVDATDCNIGVYYAQGTSGSVSGANIHGANYFGVVVNAAAVNVMNSSIHDIGEAPLNGAQHGVGVFYTTLNPNTTSTGPAATGTVSGNVFTKYQKGGIVVNGPGAAVTISGNTVTGEGPMAYTAQNGIQLGRGATGTIIDNTVTGNAYTGANNASSSGILVFGGGRYGDALTTGVSITRNTVTNNDMGVYVVNTDASGTKPPTTKTKNSIVNNTISNSQKTNVSGNGYPNGYQAGIVGYGKGDNIVNNKISGIGYDQSQAPAGSLYYTLDVDGANAHVHKNG